MPTDFRDTLRLISGPAVPAAVPVAGRYAIAASGAEDEVSAAPGLFQKADGTVWLRNPDLTETQVAGGGSQPGVAVVRGPFPFVFDTPGLTVGIPIYSLADGDIVLDAWIITTEGWDGTTPLADIGPFASPGDGGWFFNLDSGAVDMQVANSPGFGVAYPPKLNQLSQVLPAAGAGTALVCDGAVALKLVVSSDGKRGGADPGAAVGAANLWIVTTTPDAP